ncbi:MAG TPA: hypothetical protein VLA14_02920 [Polyangia bacterium]|nr:hypothetical protein [Polyangia bacterium]
MTAFVVRVAAYLALGLGAGAPARANGAATRFFGDWIYRAGTTTRACPGERPTDAPPEGGVVIAAGPAAGGLTVTEPGACALSFTSSGNVATAVAGQTCAGSDGGGGLITFTEMTWTLTLSSDGQTLSESLSAREALAPARGPARTCAYTETGVTLRR